MDFDVKQSVEHDEKCRGDLQISMWGEKTVPQWMLLLLFIVTVRKLSSSRMFSPKKHQYVTYFFGNLFSKCNFFSKQANSRQTAISQLKNVHKKVFDDHNSLKRTCSLPTEQGF